MGCERVRQRLIDRGWFVRDSHRGHNSAEMTYRYTGEIPQEQVRDSTSPIRKVEQSGK